MKFSFVLLLTSNAILATSATYDYKHIDRGETYSLAGIYEKSVRKDPDWKHESFEEAMKNLENNVEMDYARRLTRHFFGRLGLYRFNCKTKEDFKYETYKNQMVEMAKSTDNRLGFLVALELYRTYLCRFEAEANTNGDHNFLGLLRRDKIEIFLSAAAQGEIFLSRSAPEDLYRFEMLLAFGKLTKDDFPELLAKAAAQGLDRVVEILLRERRAMNGMASIWQKIKPDTTLPDLVGTHLLEYAKKKIGTSADIQETANKIMLSETWIYEGMMGAMDCLRFLALLDKEDKDTRDAALWFGTDKVHGSVDPSRVAVFLAYNKFGAAYYSQKNNFDPETAMVPKVKALLLEMTRLGLV